VKIALSEISTPGASFAEDVAAYAAAGFDGIGIWEFKLPADDAANARLVGESGLGVANCVPAVPRSAPRCPAWRARPTLPSASPRCARAWRAWRASSRRRSSA
jgi:sugar phosphate isomerase/epimerase